MATIKFSPMMGKSAKIAKFLPYNSLITFSVILVSTFGSYIILSSYADGINPIPFVVFALFMMVVDLLLRGQEPWRFDMQLWGRLPVFRLGMRHDPRVAIVPKKAKVRGKDFVKKKAVPLENEFDLIAYVDYQIQGRSVGARLIGKGDKFRLVFDWENQPFPSSISQDEALLIADGLRSGLKSIPEEEMLTFRFGCWRKLPPPKPRHHNPIISILDFWERDRLETQTALGRRTVKTLYTSATYTTSSAGEKARDIFDAAVDQVRSLGSVVAGWFFPTGGGDIPNLQKILVTGYTSGFKALDDLHYRQLKLKSRPLTCDELWELDYSRHNDGPIPPLPHRIVVKKGGIKHVVTHDQHLISAMFMLGAPELNHKRHVKLVGKNQYVRGAVLEKKPLIRFDDASPRDAFAQLIYGSAVINDCDNLDISVSRSDVYDSEVIVQFVGQDQGAVQANAIKLEEEANFNRKLAKAKDDESSRTAWKLEKSMDAGTALLDGGHSIKFAYMAMVYRDTAQDADDAIASLCNSITLSGWANPETQYFPKLWKETLPFSMNPLLFHLIYNRQLADFTAISASFIPVLADNSVAKEGVEFQSLYGSTPFYVPVVADDEVFHSITLGGTGSGKTLAEICSIIAAYKRGIPNFIIDATQANVGTFSPLCDALGGTYFDSQTDYFNPMQGTDFRRITDPDKYKFATSVLFDQWRNSITDLAIGARLGADLRADYGDLTAMLLYAWFEDAELRQRYDRAFDGGFGSSDWEVMPTLQDFLRLATLDRLPTAAQTERNRVTLEDYRARLAAFLSSSAGDRVSRPSTVDLNSLIVVCSLGGINDKQDIDILPYITAVTGLTTAAALTFPQTRITGDEAGVLSRFNCFGSAFAGYYSGGRKNGITASLITQALEPIRAGYGASSIVENNKILKVGRVTQSAADFLSTPAGADGRGGMSIPRNLLRLVDDKSDIPERNQFYSKFLIEAQGRRVIARLSLSFFQLAISVNGPKERKDRDQFLARYPNDKILGYVEYGKYLKSQSLDATAKKKLVKR
jgi:hypothetical protein